MSSFHDLPIKRKLTVAVLGTTLVTLLAACAAFLAYERVTFRRLMVRNLTVLVDALASNSTAALSFTNPDDAAETLRALSVKPTVEAACLYDADGARFAAYSRAGSETVIPARPEPDGTRFASDHLAVVRPVILNGGRLGTLYVRNDLSDLNAHLRSYTQISALILLSSLILAFVLSSALQRAITRPIFALTDTAKDIARTRDYTARAEKLSGDEIGTLTEGFNQVLAGIQERDTALQTANTALRAENAERKRAEQLLAWEKSALESIGGAASLHEVLDELMLGLEKQSPGALCSVLLLDDDGIHLRHGAAPSLPDAYNQLIHGAAIGPAVGSCGTAVYDNRQVIVADIANDPLWADYRELALAHGLRACWSTPIHGSHGKILGTVAIYYREPRLPVSSEIELIARAVHVTCIAIERREAEEKIRQLNASLERRVSERTGELHAVNASLTDFKAALDEHAIVAITDARGEITYANDRFCAISKYSRQELLGQDHRIINSGYHPKAFIRELWETITSGRVWNGEIKNRAKDGSFYWVNSTLVPFPGPDGKPSQYIAIRTDITKRKEAEEALRESGERFQTLANNISQLAWMADAQGLIFWYNQRWFDYTGTTLEEMYGWGWQKVHHPDHVQRVVDKIKHCFETGEVWEDTFPLRGTDGQYRWFLSRAVPIRDAHGMLLRWFGTNTDITERMQAEERIERLNADLQHQATQLETANKELESFSYSVSHDLRAPLRAVDGFSRMVAEEYAERLDDDGRRMLGVIRSETQRMGRLIDDLLAFSRLGRQAIEPSPIDMRAMAQEVFDEMAAAEPARRLRLDLQPIPPACGAEAMIRQVWVNLIGNAVKFTKGREVGVIEIGTGDGGDGELGYFVKDNGAGFDMRFSDKLFGVFQRLHSQQEFQGTGVGLALAQRIVQRHGGRIWAEATVGSGATFHFTLPNPKP